MPIQEIKPRERALMTRGKIWIDLENTPHIPFFRPIIRELESRGYTVVLTARDAFQTCEMASEYGMPYTKIGRHYGKNPVSKLWGLLARSVQLIPFVWRERPQMGLSHGARAQILICNLFRIPTVLVMDYEHSKTLPLVRPLWEIVPEVVSAKGLHCRQVDKIRKYSGIKEDVYVPEFKPDDTIKDRFNLNDKIVVTVRPPANEAHYHNSEADILFEYFMERLHRMAGVKAVLLPRNQAQQTMITGRFPHWFVDSKVMIPERVVDGLNLLWHSDLVVSGGGTMNREAAALGIPVYSIFRGKIGAVDRDLQAAGRLTLIETVHDVEHRIAIVPRNRVITPVSRSSKTLQDIVGHVVEIMGIHNPI